MARLLEVENGLAWTAHARIKASNWTPDAYKDEPFFKSSDWLGAAWKAMPADLSRERLGDRGLDLLDDMANWGAKKYVLGEVDVFKIDHTHELYGHMNVNYLKLDRVPKFDEDWTPVLDALRNGRFFVTTGEVLLRSFTVGGKGSGETLPAGPADVAFELEWTFPMRFAEVVSGDGRKVYRERVDLGETGPFGSRTLTLSPDLGGRRWVRVAAWDVAGNGAFSEPVCLEQAPGRHPNFAGPWPARHRREIPGARGQVGFGGLPILNAHLGGGANRADGGPRPTGGRGSVPAGAALPPSMGRIRPLPGSSDGTGRGFGMELRKSWRAVRPHLPRPVIDAVAVGYREFMRARCWYEGMSERSLRKSLGGGAVPPPFLRYPVDGSIRLEATSSGSVEAGRGRHGIGAWRRCRA